MATWIKYQIVCNESKNILLNKKIEHNDANLIIAQNEAYNGVYEIVTDDKVVEKQPLSVVLGGTGEKTGFNALRSFLASGYMILSPYQFGDEFPADAPDGTIFFKKVIE